MQTTINVKKMTIAAVLCAIGILIPIISPVKILLEPASFTLASHVAIFIAMFISPVTAVVVSLATTLGFFIYGFPLVVVLRAATHVIWAFVGAYILKKKPNLIDSLPQMLLFSFLIACLHSICEMAVVTPFYFSNGMTEGYYAKGYVTSVLLLVGAGTIVHSMVDFAISLLIWKPLRKTRIFSTPSHRTAVLTK